MTQPAFIFFGPDGAGFSGTSKVATGFHLYCTAERGRIVDGLYVRLTVNGVSTDFDTWVYGSKGLSRGSGVNVGRDGVTCDHHFLLPRADDVFNFAPGLYTVEFFANVVGDRRPSRFISISLELTAEAANAMRDGQAGVWFTWRPASRRYEASVETAQEVLERQLRKAFPNVGAVAGSTGPDLKSRVRAS